MWRRRYRWSTLGVEVHFAALCRRLWHRRDVRSKANGRRLEWSRLSYELLNRGHASTRGTQVRITNSVYYSYTWRWRIHLTIIIVFSRRNPITAFSFVLGKFMQRLKNFQKSTKNTSGPTIQTKARTTPVALQEIMKLHPLMNSPTVQLIGAALSEFHDRFVPKTVFLFLLLYLTTYRPLGNEQRTLLEHTIAANPANKYTICIISWYV